MDDQTDSVLDGTPRFDEPSAAALRECPHCKAEARSGVTWGDYGESGWVECTGCTAIMSSDMGGPEADAIAAWNRRDGEDARVAEAVAAERARIIDRVIEAAAFPPSGGLLLAREIIAIVQGGAP